MSSAKKIGLFACTGVVAGNMMGSGIALLPANLASIGGIAILGLGNFNYWCDVSGLCLCPTGH
ncbi:Lysine/cadaverine antiporter membrane protein CadB [Klebsiella pneumoniae]|uniref:Lysine/cadaverine antiporter membrane protein CadB n=1 Tax=Klebsiella pneumoniae TaxID=573 RepID=A0A2X3C757_KLEPN|nr:Lysine/cadaverine antiporter membrane protein CadB [Klebsiella pneumoniae]